LFETPAETRKGGVCASRTPAGVGANARRAPVPGTTAEHGDHHGRIYRRRRRRGAPGLWLQTIGKTHEGNRSKTAHGDDAQWNSTGRAGSDCPFDHIVRALWIS